MVTIDERSPVPIYEQIKTELRGLVARGLLEPGEQVPAIRSLAETLLVNPNTIARAYRELILEGFLESRRGEGNFVSAKARRQVGNGLETAARQLQEAILTARRSGLPWSQIRSIVHQAQEDPS